MPQKNILWFQIAFRSFKPVLEKSNLLTNVGGNKLFKKLKIKSGRGVCDQEVGLCNSIQISQYWLVISMSTPQNCATKIKLMMWLAYPALTLVM